MKETPEAVKRAVASLPDPWASVVEHEGIVLLAEGVRGSLFLPFFRAPGKLFWRRREWYAATLALSAARFLVIRDGTSPVMNVRFSDPRFGQMRFELKKRNTLVVSHDAALFHADWSGTLEHRFRTPEAPRFLELLLQHGPAAGRLRDD